MRSLPSLLAAALLAAIPAIAQNVKFAETSRSYILEEEFRLDPTLVALPHQVAVLSLEPAGPTAENGLIENVTRYQLGAGTYHFCLNKAETLLRMLTVSDSEGHSLLEIYRNSCADLNLPSGVYRISAWHDPRLLHGTSSIGFLQMPAPSLSVLDADGDPKQGYWAIRPDPALDPTGNTREGRVTSGAQLCLIPQSGSECVVKAVPVVADWTSQAVDYASIFDFYDRMNDRSVLGNSPLFPNAAFYKNAPNYLYAVPDELAYLAVRMNIEDLGNLNFMFGADKPGFFLDKNSIFNELVGSAGPPSPYVKTQLILRWFPAVDKPLFGPVNLDEGEIALFTGKTYGADGIVFGLDIPDLSAFTSPNFAIAAHTQSVRLGFNTAAILYPGKNFTGTPEIVEADTPDTTILPVGKVLGSLQIRPLLPLFIASKNCVGCILPNVDLSSLNLNGANVQGADFSGASFQKSNLQLANFAKATLSSTSFQGAQLQGSHFDNASLVGAAFDGADLTRATLAGADLTQASLSHTTLKEATLRNAKLYGAKLIDSNLQSANLSGTFLTNLPRKNISAATLTGAYLFNASFYQAQLSGADFTNASFYGETPAGQGQCAIDDQGRTQNCASAAYATMNNTQFGGAYLFGVDFTHATVQGVQFGNAVLIGANFTAANLSADPTVGTNSGFSGSFLQGANLASANLNFISLANAFMDFTAGGNIVDMLLDGSHTVFPFTGTPPAEASARNPTIQNQQPFLPGTRRLSVPTEAPTPVDAARLPAPTSIGRALSISVRPVRRLVSKRLYLH